MARLTKLAIGLILAVFSVHGRALQPITSQGTELIVANVNVIDVARGRTIANQTVTIRDGRILRVEDAGDASLGVDDRVIDGTGGYLAPGFVDMHVHVSDEGDLFTYVANGVTTVRNMAGDEVTLALRRRIAAGSLIGPRIITSGPILESGEASSTGNVVVNDQRSAALEVRRQHQAGYDFIKVYNNMPLAVYRAVSATARRVGMPVAGHVPFDVGIGGALRARQASVEHLRGYVQELVPGSAPVQPGATLRDRSVAWNYAAPDRMASLAERTAAAGVWNCPTFVFTAHELATHAAYAQLLARPELRYLSRRGVTDRRSVPYLQAFADADFAATQRGLEQQFELIRALDRAGAGLLVGTDSWLAGFAYEDELGLLVRAGLSPARVLRMATMDAARFLGEDRDWGQVRAGQRADLVILDANPLTDISNARRIRAVILNGRLIQRQQIDQRLATIAATRLRPS